MSTDFEQLLRDRLRAEAAQVSPDPETWTKVQAGIRRERRFRLVYAGAAGTAVAALAAVAVLVVPGLLSQPDVGLLPGGDVAEQPEAPADPAPPSVGTPGLPGIVLGTPDGITVVASGAAGGSAASVGGAPVDALAVHPGSTPDVVDVVAAADCSLSRFTAGPDAAAASALDLFVAVGCQGGPRFSPDGGHLAWIEEGADGVSLRTVGWDDGPVHARNAGWTLDFADLVGPGVEEVGEVRITEWVWTEWDGTTAEGFLVLSIRGRGDGATNDVMTVPIGQQADGALAIPRDQAPTVLDGAEGMRIIAYQRTAAATWTIEVDETSGATGLTRSDEGEQIWALASDALPDGFDDAGRVWLEVVGETAVIGDGAGRVVTVPFLGDGWGDVEPLAAADGFDTRIGGAIGAARPDDPAEPFAPVAPSPPAPEAEPEPEATAPPEEEPLPEPPAEEEGDRTTLTPEAAATRDAILDAVAARDLEALGALTGPDFSHSFGDVDGDPVAFWEAEIRNGIDIFGILERFLALDPVSPIEYDDGSRLYEWPIEEGLAYESLSSAQLVSYTELLGQEAMDAWQGNGFYLGYRIGIRSEGTWQFFIAGD
jgi:hypothetical protein